MQINLSEKKTTVCEMENTLGGINGWYDSAGEEMLKMMAIDTMQTEINKLILKLIWNYKGPRIVKTSLKKEKQSWKTTTLWFQDLIRYSN